MQITKLSLTNFRSFRATQHIEFAPLTMLFGPNSVGKSSVLMALFYFQQILEKGHCDPVQLEALGQKHVGGFESLVNGRDIDKKIFIRIEADKRGEIGASYAKIPNMIDDDFGLTVDSPTADADQFAVELQIAWSKLLDTAYVASCKFWLDGHSIAELSSDAGLKRPLISSLNFDHPSLCEDSSDHADDETVSSHSRLRELLVEAGYVKPKSDDTEALPFVSREAIGFNGLRGALPPIGKLLDTVIDLESPLLTARVHEILTDILVAPLDNLLSLLKKSLCIGPLRIIPDARYQTNPYPQQKDWYTGAAAWDVIGRSVSQRDEINYWLCKPHTLDLGYSLRSKSEMSTISYFGGDDDLQELLKVLDSAGSDGLKVSFSTDDLDENPGAEKKTIDVETLKQILKSQLAQQKPDPTRNEVEVRRKTVLWDDVNNLELSSTDIGVGVSQLLPLIVAAVENNQGLIACEQPELHVHPRVQVGIGDLLTQCRKNAYLIETHSEHLILRILKRIRQTSEKQLPDGIKPVKPEDVSIVYFEPFDSGVKARRIHIDEEGEFIERWPRGFFAERAEELF